MARDYETILREALELHAVDRAKLVDALARSLAAEAGIDNNEALLNAETAQRLDDNLARAKKIEDARIEAAVAKAKARNNDG